MSEHALPQTAGHVDLGDGYVLHVSNLLGTVQVTAAPPVSRGLATSPIEAALQEAGLRLDKVIVLSPARGVSASRDLASPRPAQPSIAQLDVDVQPDESYLVLIEDNATHALSWVIPDQPPAPTTGARALSTTLRFTLPMGGAPASDGTRGLADIAAVGKTIKAFAFRLTDALLGPIIHGFARRWETKHRPTFTRMFGPDNYQSDDPNFPPLNEAGWRQLSQGRALLLVHGTFSTCGTFAPLGGVTIAELSRRYAGRVFAFNHPTMAADPRDNAVAFLSAIPPSLKLEVDIVCHSRGGLVAREIAALGQTQGSVNVRQIVFVGATNAGTTLADADHMVDMIDRFTTIAKFIPPGPAQKIVDALVLVLKVVGHGFLDDLEGLKAMDPSGAFIAALNIPGAPAPDLFAIASDFQPPPGTPFFSLTRLEGLTMDRVFEGVANDLVVPLSGVFAKNGAGGFPIGEARCLLYGPADGVIHTEFFSQPRTAAKLLEWLLPVAPETRTLAAGPSFDEVARALDAYHHFALATLTGNRSTRGAQADPQLTPAELQALRPHVVTLKEGALDQGTVFSTTEADVDAIIREYIPQWAQAQPPDEPLRIVLWAHGGLVGIDKGLRIALEQVDWWRKNGVYPDRKSVV